MKSLLFRGWIRALLQSIVVLLCVIALGEIVSFLLFAARVFPHESAALAARQGLLFFFLFHHVAPVLYTPALQIPSAVNNLVGLPLGSDVTATLGIAFLSGLAVAAWVLARAGRAIANGAGGSPLARAVHGAKVAVPYATVSLVLSYYAKVTLTMPRTSSFVVQPAHFGAFTWPLSFGIVFGAIGGMRSDPSSLHEWLDWRMTAKWVRRWSGAIAGTTTTLLLMMAFAFAGLMVMGIFSHASTSAYFRAISRKGMRSGIALGALTLFAAPNMAAWVLVPAMGGCLEVGGTGSLTSAPTPYCFLSYSNTLAHPHPWLNREWRFLGFHELGAPPAWFWLFLAVPIAAAFIGGVRAARAARPSGARESLIVTTLSALLISLLTLVLLGVSWITLTTKGTVLSANNYIRYGPYPFDGAQLIFGWSLFVGGLGGLWAYRRAKRRSVT